MLVLVGWGKLRALGPQLSLSVRPTFIRLGSKE